MSSLRRFSPDLSGNNRNRSGHENFDLDHKPGKKIPEEQEDLEGVDKEKTPGEKLNDAKEFMNLDES
jgi:hypothetical protein